MKGSLQSDIKGYRWEWIRGEYRLLKQGRVWWAWREFQRSPKPPPVYSWDRISKKRKAEAKGTRYFIWNRSVMDGHQYYFRSEKVYLAYYMIENDNWEPHVCRMGCEGLKEKPVLDIEAARSYFMEAFTSPTPAPPQSR
jgi:hypothetical protein